jgi:hypothetical protein
MKKTSSDAAGSLVSMRLKNSAARLKAYVEHLICHRLCLLLTTAVIDDLVARLSLDRIATRSG